MENKKRIKRFNDSFNNLIKEDVGKSKIPSWELDSKISSILESNIKEIPYEGTEVDKYGLRNSILELIYELCPEYRPDFDKFNDDYDRFGYRR